MSPNPFRHQDPAQCRNVFFNRDADVRKVLIRLRKGQSVSVVSEEGIVRTLFLPQVSDPQVAAQLGLVLQDHLFCYLDCKQWTDLDEDGCFNRIKAVWEEAILDWEAPIPVPEGVTFAKADYWLDQTLFLFDRADVQLTMQLDDVDRLADNEQSTLMVVLNYLRSLSEAHDALTYLTTSRVSLVELQSDPSRTRGSPFFDIFWDYMLRPLNPDESRSLLVAGLESVGVAFSEGVLEFIAYLSHGEPCRMLLVCACAHDVWCEKIRCPLCDGDCGEIEKRFNQDMHALGGGFA